MLDTRDGTGTGGVVGPVGEGQTTDVQMAGVGSVPADAVGVVLNVTGTRPTSATFVTTWPTGQPRPNSSTLNLTPGIDAPNGATALLGLGGKLSFYNDRGSADLIAKTSDEAPGNISVKFESVASYSDSAQTYQHIDGLLWVGSASPRYDQISVQAADRGSSCFFWIQLTPGTVVG